MKISVIYVIQKINLNITFHKDLVKYYEIFIVFVSRILFGATCKMLTCFVCKLEINDPEKLFSHIKKIHGICGNDCACQCTLCGKLFTKFSRFKTHIEMCFANTPVEITIHPDTYEYAVDEAVCRFDEKLKKAALELVCSLASNMRSPRSEIFTVVAAVRKIYLPEIVSGIQIFIIFFALKKKKDYLVSNKTH